ncbi:lytic transglycosylase domain-containing protein [Alloacidobacterium sp.]|uniref:lytic transglycosylase domain-containing protein n=1 Tax=Alloacidobacterium sp. TaxID=2951999 RepID=UPI002D5B3DE8|nr:transglycosylase SLT domain-containing protein [Alloacidobacterium sp.]HYK35362.1 transglycosylase SLT domain-containing protein [Alloacidobacterium sp.]
MVVAKLSGAAIVAAIASLLCCSASAEGQASPVVPGAAQQGQPTAAPQKTAPSPQAISSRDQSLIDSVEHAYQTGLSNYRDGHIDAARSNFNYAIDMMLRSGIDIKNDTAISEEFDHIVDAVNTLELDAVQEKGIQTAQQHPEDAPVDIANDVTFPVDPTVRAQAEAELKTTQSDLPLVMNDYVAGYINFFTNTVKGHNTIVNSLTRAGRYKDMIERVLKEEGVPQDLIYQAVAESGFRPQAVNPRSRAGGMWQFMPGDAFAPERSAWFDDRFDPEKATRAYAKYIKYLYDQLGDWYLAMASYDWGAGNIQRAVERTGYADFWELYRRNNLPQETKNYVPIILAVTIMAKNPKQYGLTDLVPDPPLVTDTVTTNNAVDLRLVADVVDAPLQEIESLNPSLLRMSTPPDEPFDLHLPKGTKDLYEKRIAEIPEDKRRYWRFHILSSSESLEDLAHQYHVSASEIAFVNQLSSTSADLGGVDSLVIPVAPSAVTSSARNSTYKVRHGDTLVTVADRFGVTVEQLRRWNHLSGDAIAPGHKLYVSEPARISTSRSRHGKTTARSSQAASHHGQVHAEPKAAAHTALPKGKKTDE